MSGFLQKAFGWLGGRSGGDASPGEADGGKARSRKGEPYRDCVITPTPMHEGSQWRVAGTISRERDDGTTMTRTFIRADLFSSETDAADFALRKAQQIIDQNPALFADGAATGTA